MRRVLIKVVIVVALVVVMSILWIFGGRQLSLFLDRFGTVELVSAPIKSISYEGTGSGGILHVNDLALSLNSLNPLLPSLEIGTTKTIKLRCRLADTFLASGSDAHHKTTNSRSRPRSAMTLRLQCGGALSVGQRRSISIL